MPRRPLRACEEPGCGRLTNRRLCDPCEERVQRERVALTRPSGLEPSAIPITIVCGPPAAGKSSYVRRHAGPRDLVIDLDQIAARLSGYPPHASGREWLEVALLERNTLLHSLAGGRGRWDAAWFIVGAPAREDREAWQRALGGTVVVLETPPAVCVERIRRDRDRSARAGEYEAAVRRWWAAYTPWAGDSPAVHKYAGPGGMGAEKSGHRPTDTVPPPG